MLSDRTTDIDWIEIVYDPNMPKTLPPLLVIRRATQQVFFFLVFVVRAIFVGFIWLALLPWVTMWTWRMYFLMGDSTCVILSPFGGTPLMNHV